MSFVQWLPPGVQMDTKEFYDQVSPAYYRETYEDVSTLTSIARSIRTQTVLEMMRRHVRPESVVADLGCGPAQFADAILEGHNKYIGLDISQEMYGERRNVLRATLGYRSWRVRLRAFPCRPRALTP